MAWYDNAVFYHIYPLGLCGCAHENDGQPVPGAFKKLDAWAEHAAELGCTAIYIGPLFESGSHGYDTIDYRQVDRRLGTNEEFKNSSPTAMRGASGSSWTACSTMWAAISSPSGS